ncbi:amidohydrolase family protein [Leucobacter iarius]|uniref:Amidohydrolase family protein n=1 Tax=Leucobacter iarius TaxID=333963 RepID=A0ABN2LKI8_9MICO
MGAPVGTEAVRIVRAALHGRDGEWDLVLGPGPDGEVVVREILPHATGTDAAGGEGVLDACGGLVSRAFAEPHVHPDKSYSLSVLPDGIDAAELASLEPFERAARIKSAFTPENVAARAERALRLAVSNGVTRARATADVDTVAGLRGFEGLLRAREAVAELLDVEIVAFPQEGLIRDPGAESLLRAALEAGADLVGGWPNVEAAPEDQRAHVRTVFDLAQEFDVDVDIHADCFLDPEERILEFIAEETIRRGYQGRVLTSHCAALELQTDDDARRIIACVAEAGITIAVIPLNLADGGPRGLSRPQELLAAGVPVVSGTDNLNDGWYPLGTLNPLDRASMTFWGGSFDDEDEVDTVWDLVSGAAWRALGAGAGDLAVGMPAELVILDAADRAGALRDPGCGLTTIHRGRIVSRRAVTRSFAGAAQ